MLPSKSYRFYIITAAVGAFKCLSLVMLSGRVAKEDSPNDPGWERKKKQYFLTALRIEPNPKYLIGRRAGLEPVIKLERKKRFRVSLYA